MTYMLGDGQRQLQDNSRKRTKNAISLRRVAIRNLEDSRKHEAEK